MNLVILKNRAQLIKIATQNVLTKASTGRLKKHLISEQQALIKNYLSSGFNKKQTYNLLIKQGKLPDFISYRVFLNVLKEINE